MESLGIGLTMQVSEPMWKHVLLVHVLPFVLFVAAVVGVCTVCGWLVVTVPLYGDPLPESVLLHNATDTRVEVWQNVDGFNDRVAELNPGESKVVEWLFWDNPTYRAEDSNGNTIYCGPHPRETFTRGGDRTEMIKVEITRMSSVSLQVVHRRTLCQPP
jgi:hypothetical protein